MKSLLPILALGCCLALPSPTGVSAQSNNGKTVVVEGGCNYSDSLAPLIEENHVFVECDRVEMRRVGGQEEVEFAFPARLRSIEFRGSYTGQGRYVVTKARLRSPRKWEEAEGQCDFDSSAGGLASATCLVRIEQRFYVVDFAAATW